MTDYKTHGRSRIDIDEEYYWAEKWGVSRAEVRQAVEKVGPLAKDVAAQLGKSA